MGSVSLKKDSAEEKLELENEEALAEVLGPEDEGETALAAPASFQVGAIVGDVRPTDIRLSQLKIKQKTSDGELPNGTISLDGQQVVEDKEGAVNLTVIFLEKKYDDRVAFGEPRGRSYNNLEEVLKAGKWVDWRDNQPPPVEEYAVAFVLVEKPKDLVSQAFPYEIEGKQYAPAVWYLRNTAYKSAAKEIFSRARVNLANVGLLKGKWKLYSDKKEGKNGTYWVPRIRLSSELNTDEFVTAVKETVKF